MRRPWSSVRVFISSTFKDMQAERDHLVRHRRPRRDSNLTAPCAHCGERFVVTDDMLGQEIECPSCKGTLRLTPFVCDNR